MDDDPRTRREVLIYTRANNKHKGPPTNLGLPCDIDSEKLKLSLLTERRKALHKTNPPPRRFCKSPKGRKTKERTNKQTNKNSLACANYSITCTIIVSLPPTPL
jgi:hypothetical protein